MKENYLEDLRLGRDLTPASQIRMIIKLSIPAVMGQVSSVVMQYIDASMVGRLGAEGSAAIGLMASTTWLLNGIVTAAAVGFTVQVAQSIGAGDEGRARNLVKTGLLTTLLFSMIVAAFGAFISHPLPIWMGGDASITHDAFLYLLVYALALPFEQMLATANGMIQGSGNMRVPGVLMVTGCGLDVIFNLLFIFPSSYKNVLGMRIFLPGAGLGVLGAAIGTALSKLVTAIILLTYLLFISKPLRLRRGEGFRYRMADFRQWYRLSIPVGIEQIITSLSYIIVTRIVSPLGNIAIAANSFAITAESLCYMPGYGVGSAATTIIGQTLGAGRKSLARRFGWITTFFGMVLMGITGALMYWLAPYMMSILTPDAEIAAMGVTCLRLAAFTEPMFAASIVASGALRGAGDTLVPCIMNIASMWILRLPLAYILSHSYGLRGVWIGMCIELFFRGAIFLGRLKSKKWSEKMLSKC